MSSGVTSGSGTTGAASGSGSVSTPMSGSAADAGVTGSGQMSGTISGSGSGTSPCTASGSSVTGGAGAIGGGSGAVASGASSGSDAGLGSVKPSPGCRASPWTEPTGQWVSQPTCCSQGTNNQGTAACQAIPPGSTVPAIATQGSPERRGWWVYVPTGYDPSKAYKVIYSAAGPEDPDSFHAGTDGYPYYDFDNAQAILVGLDYDTYSDVPPSFDSRDPQSNDFTFFPWLQSRIESQFCVDMSHEFFSGYSSGAWLAQQLNCAFPDKLRGFVAYSGCEPGAAGYPGSQPACVSKPTAALFVHDLYDEDSTYACILPACARVLKQNGCVVNGAVPECDPMDKTITTPYEVPAGVRLPAITGANSGCVSFNGCPADYPVVFCTTTNQSQTDGQAFGVVPLFWDWMSSKLAN